MDGPSNNNITSIAVPVALKVHKATVYSSHSQGTIITVAVVAEGRRFKSPFFSACWPSGGSLPASNVGPSPATWNIPKV